jgi:metal-dependent amidase/aminoacylase/carboxypeptidase family protein
MQTVEKAIVHFKCNFEQQKIMLKEKIKALANTYADEFIAVRHHLHAHPELSYQEFETSKFVQSKLASYNIPFEVMAATGIVG